MTTAALPYPLDPQIQRFVERMQADSAAHPRRDLVPVEQAHAISEAVRRPWAEGGPQMARTREIHVPTPHGPVRLRVYTPRAARPGWTWIPRSRLSARAAACAPSCCTTPARATRIR
ncbi:hypothetical protein OMF51_07780 [Bordetella pertussis]